MGNRIQRGPATSRTQRTNTCGTSSRANSAIQTCQGSLLTNTVSCLCEYSLEQFSELVANVTAEGYEWHIGEDTRGWLQLTIFLVIDAEKRSQSSLSEIPSHTTSEPSLCKSTTRWYLPDHLDTVFLSTHRGALTY
jgi:hypothetical protein